MRQGAVLGAKTLLRSPGLDQRAVYGKVLVRHELLRLRLFRDLGEETLQATSRELQQPIAAVLGEHRMVPHRIVHAQAHEPAKPRARRL